MKSERMLVEKAQKQRQRAKANHRRQLYKDSLDEIMNEQAIHLRAKHALDAINAGKPFEY